MLEGKPTPAGSSYADAGYSYPRGLARFVRTDGGTCQSPLAASTRCPTPRRWRASSPPASKRACCARRSARSPSAPSSPSPRSSHPRGGRPRACSGSRFPVRSPSTRGNSGGSRWPADPQRTLIGVRRDGEGGLRIWGLINSGTRWLRDVYGGRRAGAPLPPAPVVHVNAPGSIEAYKGHELIGKLQGGRLSGHGWTPSSRNGCRASSPGSWRNLQSGTRSPATALASSLARGGRHWSRRLSLRIAERMMKRS